MKKVSLFILMLVSMACLVACNSPSSVQGEFLNKEYILSLDEVKDFYDEFNVKGVEKNKIVLVSSNNNIISSNDGEEFKALSSGNAYIFAKYKNKTVAKTKVSVKYVLSAPQNFNLSTDGVLTWDHSYAVINGQKVVATDYDIEFGQILVVDGDVNYEFKNVTTNSLTFPKKASYSVKIKANCKTNKIVDSSITYERVFHYGVMGTLEEVTFEVGEDFASQQATISWAEKVDAKYDVYVEGFKLGSDITTSSYTFDYSVYEGGKTVQVEVVAKDLNDEKMSTSTKLQVHVLKAPEIEYKFNKEGKLVWENDVHATAYKLRITDYEGNTSYKDITDKAVLEEVLYGNEENIYDVSIVAVGGENDGFYASSAPSKTLRTAKLPFPEVSLEFNGNIANLTFAENDYITDYKLTYNFNSVYYSTKYGLTTSIDMSILPVGGYKIDVVALPKADSSTETGVAKYNYKSDGSELVLNSDSISVEFYVLDQIGDVIHVLNENISTFTFPSVENANFYRLYVNDSIADANIFESNGIVTCQLTNLKYFVPRNDGYDIKIIAGHIDLYTGKEIATRSEKTKRLEILDAPKEATSQTNGNFAWQDIADDCLYSYEVYKTESNYALTTGQTPILSESNVDVLEIAETLEEGYYKVRVKSVSKDRNVYLDSDFNDEENILEVNFYVTQEIEEPSATFFVDGDDYKLTINTVEYASLYEVYVDGELDGQLSSEGLAQEEYVFSNEFATASKHEVKVKALAGSRYDGTIYTESTEFKLYVTRHALPQYVVNITYTDFDTANHEWLTIKEVANTTGVKFMLNGNEVTGETYRLDMSNYNIFGTDFKVGMVLIAGEGKGNEYYLNSHLKEINFLRANYPTSIKYTNGNLTWTQTQQNATKNYISLIVDTATGSDYYKRFEVAGTSQSHELQSYIDNLRKTDLAFDTAYRQVEKLQVKMLSYMNEESDKYYLPSFYGTSKNGTNTLDIDLLESPVLKFDVETKTISWDYDISETMFDIYVDDVLVKEGYNLANSINLSELSGFDFTTQKKITIRARHASYLDSDISSPIYIKELITPSTLNIVKDGSEYRASILINNDSTHVSSVYVNGSSNNVTYTEGGNIASFALSDFAGITNFEINLVAKNEGNLNYYISSAPVSYTLINLANESFEASVGAMSIDWTALGEEIMGNDIFPIRYVLTFTNNGKTFTKIYNKEYTVKLEDLETIAGQELVGEVKAVIKGIVSEDYTLTSNGKGYYGEITSLDLITHKLDKFNSVTVELVNGAGSTEIDRKINSSLKVKFDDVWSAYSNVSFLMEVKIAGLSLTLPQSGVTHLFYSFAKVGTNYEFKLSSIVIKNLPAGQAEISIQAMCEKEISSNVHTLSIKKYATTQGGEVSENGVLTINDNQANASYLVEIAIEDVTLEASVLNSDNNKTLSLMMEELILNRYGAYTIRVLTFDENNSIIPATEVLNISGYKLQGIENVYVNDEGDVIFELYMDSLTNVIFTAKCDNVIANFTPTLVEGKENEFSIPMLELLRVFEDYFELIEGEYNFEFSVRNDGSIDSAWKPLTFNYAIDQTPVLLRGDDLDKDYIVFEIGEKSDTVSFRTIITANFPERDYDEEGNEIIIGRNEEIRFTCINALVVRGYWVKDTSGNDLFFVTEKGTEAEGSDLVYTECYAICVNDLLADLDYGWAEIKLSRVGKLDDIYYQYNETTFNEYKLNKVNDVIGNAGAIAVKDNYLNFSWTKQDSDDQASKDYLPTTYYVMFANETGNIVKQVSTFVCSLDLRTVGLTSGSSYTIYVMAVSAEKNVLASDLSHTVATLRYTTPLALEVKEGMLTFNIAEFETTDFIQDMKTYFGQTTETLVYHNEIGNKQYTSPYFFSPALLDELYVTLRFTKLDAAGGVTNQVYTTTVLGYWLFPDLTINSNLSDYGGAGSSDSYFTLLQRYSGQALEGKTTVEAVNTKSMIDALLSSPRGIADNAVMFDDVGRSIPAGEYMVSVIQTKSNQFIESTNSEAVKMYLSAAPEIALKTEVVSNISQYMIDLSPSLTKVFDGTTYNLEAARRYKLSLRPSNAGSYSREGNMEFIITYNDSTSTWEIAYNGEMLEDVISNNEAKSNYGLPGYTVNMSALRKAVGEIPANTLLRADVLVYAQDDGYVINGKSAIFNVRYLDLSADTINFTDGQFVVTSELDSSYELLVKYKLSSQGQANFVTKFINNEAVIQFNNPGYYEYIVLSLNGSISFNTMNVESASYAIENLYKLTAPTMSTSNSNLFVAYGKTDIEYFSTIGLDTTDYINFNMANDITLAEGYMADDRGYYYRSPITENTKNTFSYAVGSKDTAGNTVYPSELSASVFYAYLNGNTGTFELAEGSGLADCTLIFSQDWVIMTSEHSSLNARMLKNIEAFEISKGDLQIYGGEAASEIVTDLDQNPDSGNLVYEVTIEYYILDNDNTSKFLLRETNVFYTERQFLTEDELVQAFSGYLFNSNYDYFKVSIIVLGALKVEEGYLNSIKTVEGNYVLLSNAVCYEDGAHVLRSQAQLSTNYISRTAIPYLVAQSRGVREGKLNFVIDKSIYYSETINGIDADTSKRILVYAEYTQGGNTNRVQITGKFAFTPDTSGSGNEVYVIFTPDEGQLNDIVGAFDILIYAYGNGTVISKPLYIKTIYKLPNITSRYYSIQLDDNANTLIDLSTYFENVTISNDNKCFKLVISYKVAGENEVKTITLTSNSNSQKVIIPTDTTILSIQSQDGQDGVEANAKKLIYSDTTIFNVRKTDIEGLSLTWNSQEMRFEWAWADGRTDEYEYHVSITMSGTGRTTTETVTTNYYLPKERGLIASGGFEIRARQLGDTTSNNLNTFSNRLVYSGDEVMYNLYSGGNGSKTNPYLIKNKTDFINMAKRNTNDFYFKLDVDELEISMSDLYDTSAEELVLYMQDFNAHFDGNGYAIKVISTEVINLVQPYSQTSLIGKANLEFTQYSSLFRNISYGATVENLFIKYVIDYNQLNTSNILFAPLAAFNYGTINNVRVSSFEISRLNGTGLANNAFVGGIVSVNYGTIKNSNNTAEINYTMAQQLNLTFGYAGITLFNIANNTTFAGKIENCYASSTKTITVSVSNNLVYLAGIALTNSGTISKAGNDGSLVLAARSTVASMTGYYAGVVVANNNGILEYVYNNGTIEKSASQGNLNYGGIAYSISNGKINTLVTTVSGQPLVTNCTSKPTDVGTNYASSNSGTSSNIATKALSAQVINCGSGYTLTISETESGYRAVIAVA